MSRRAASALRAIVCLVASGVFCIPTSAHAQDDARPVAGQADDIRWTQGCEAAIPLYRDAIAARPDDGLSHYFLGYCLHVTGDLEAAIDAHARAAEFPAYRAEALYNLAGAYALLGQDDRAIETLSRSIDLGVRDHDQNAYRIVTDSDFESLKSDPRFLAQMQRLAGPAFELAVSDWEPERAAEGLAAVMDVIENRHPNPYRYFSPADFAAQARAIIDRIEEHDVETYSLALMRLVAMIGDVHTSLWTVSGSDILSEVLPLRLWRFTDGLYVRAAPPEHASLVGAKINRIGSFDVEEGWHDLVADNPRENDSMATGWLQYLLLLPAFHRLNGWSDLKDAAVLEIVDREGNTRTVTLAAVQGSGWGDGLESSLGLHDAPADWVTVDDRAPNTPTWLRDADTNYWYEPLEEASAYYLAVNLSRNDPDRPWASFLEELFTAIRRDGATRLIVDLRHNPGGWHYMAQALGHHVVRSNALHRAGGVCVLTSRTTQSAGIYFSALLERETHAIFAGEPGGAAPNFYNGPQGFFSPRAVPGAPLRIKHSTSMMQTSDQRDTRRAIAPDLPVSFTFGDYSAGRDPGLEACVQLDEETAASLLADSGGRPLPLYFQWRRPSQAAMFPAGPPRDY